MRKQRNNWAGEQTEIRKQRNNWAGDQTEIRKQRNNWDRRTELYKETEKQLGQENRMR